MICVGVSSSSTIEASDPSVNLIITMRIQVWLSNFLRLACSKSGNQDARRNNIQTSHGSLSVYDIKFQPASSP